MEYFHPIKTIKKLIKIIICFVFVLFNSNILTAQQKDTLYVQEYPHKWWVKFFVPNKMLTIQHKGISYNPTYPQNIGIGLGLRKIIGMNLLLSFSVFPLKTDTGLSSHITDFQMHKYGKKILLDGYYQDYRDVLNSPKRNGSTNLMAGDLKYYDFNGDGKIDGDDQTRMGSGTSPRANFGLNADASYKGWSFSMLWQGATNYNIYVDNILMGGNSNYLPVIYDFQKDIWSPENRNALYPRQHASPGFNGSNNFVGTDFWLVDAYYLRLKSMSIGYDLKHKLLKHVGWMTKCNLSLSGYNLLTFSPAKKWGFDPESGSNGNGYGYPISRVYTISLNIGF